VYFIFSDFHRRIVGMHREGLKHHLLHQLVNRREELGDREHPAVERLPREFHPLPLEDAFQAIERQMVTVLAHDHLGQQARPGQTARNRLGRLLGHDHVLLRKRKPAFGKLLPPGVFLPHVNRHEKRRRLPIDLLAPLFADLDQILRTAQRFLFRFREIVDDFHSREVIGYSSATVRVAVRRRSHRRFARQGCLSRLPGKFFAPLEQQPLVRIELFARASIDAAQK
jgi:transposase InsO family protein